MMAVIDTSFPVTGGETKRPPNNLNDPNDPSQRQINILAPFGIPSADQWTGQKVWLLLPGFTEPADYYDTTLATSIDDANPDDTVLALDWTEVTGTNIFNFGPAGVVVGDLYRSGSWITPVATAVREKLALEWGMPAAALNIVGHSLGAHLASEIAASFNTTYGSQVGSVIALDPASNTAAWPTSPYDRTNGYDTDLSNGYARNGGTPDPIKRLDLGAATSRSFNGISSLAGNETQAGTAKESFLFDFSNPLTDQHAAVTLAYTKLVATDPNGNSRLATNILGLDDTQADHQFRPNFYKGGSSYSVQVHEGVIPVDAQNNPLFLVAAKLNGGTNDRLIYGTNGDDQFTQSGPFTKYYNNNGNHTYSLGNGDDFVNAGTGNDTIYGGAGGDTVDGGNGINLILGEEGNDIILSGTGNDTIQGGAGIDIIDAGDGTNNIYGDEGNDYLTGGNGINRFFGGSGNDVLEGGTGLNLLKGTDSNTTLIDEVDTLTGNPNARSNAFYIGDNGRNWYSANGDNDYALIVNFNPQTDVIFIGVNIESQEIGFQTFLWSGNELIAKIDGLWASQLPYFIR
ncbi:hypothetical protein [Kamptonema sp. UHCC 0994]|uniref:hypothetical protein n=1 Tax=Kamptonema sp. UHCC 0994 TaxID=3031329 RepID=UPI0023B8DA19|nr:hypothetical protein [Kamptonema sp. UHCC 0994]MDF0555779.1 hypothetical protein [Kamptonema sp. UHCC 0994]